MNSVSLKAKIQNFSKDKGVPHQKLMYNFFFTRLLRKIYDSKYSKVFVLHGGFLLEILAGVNVRTTVDMDLSIFGKNLEDGDNIEKIFREICAHKSSDEVIFKIDKVKLVATHIPGSIRVSVIGKFGKITNQFYVDLVKESFDRTKLRKIKCCPIFDKQTFEIWIPGFPNQIANKLDAILKRGIQTTRGKDFYDIYIYRKLIDDSFSFVELRKCLLILLPDINKTKAIKIIQQLFKDNKIKQYVSNFLKTNEYTKVQFEDTINSLYWFVNKTL